MEDAVQQKVNSLISEDEGDEQFLDYVDAVTDDIELQDNALEVVRMLSGLLV